MSESTPSKDATQPAIITDLGVGREVSENIERIVEEGKRAGVAPLDSPSTSSALHPRAHIPKYEGKMRGILPDDHPTRLREQAEYKAARRREKERDDAMRVVEAGVPQKIELGARVVIGSNAQVDYEDENGVRVKGHYGGIEGEVFQTYVDNEGRRRHIIVDKDPATGKSKYAPVGVRECDLTELSERTHGGARRFHTVPKSLAQREAEATAARERHATMTPEDIERAQFGGHTAAEMAALMCGL